MSLDLTRCPDCDAPAEVEWRAVMERTWTCPCAYPKPPHDRRGSTA